MRSLPRVAAAASCLLLAFSALPAAIPSAADEGGYVGLGLQLRRLNTVGVFMQATAHPDDENNGLLVMLGRGQGIRTVLATATRGDGGQNEIGPELFDALGVLRTAELASVHRVDGAEQYFTRAVDFGYSFSVEETFERWGRREILGDYVRLIRTIRPDVVVTMPLTGTGGGLHHQASALLAKDAFRAAGDPGQFSEQIREGLRPWQARKLYVTASFGFRGAPPPDPAVRAVAVEANEYDPLLGSTYQELGSLARSMHKCQGMAQLLTLPGTPFTFRYALADTTIAGQMEKDEKSLFDGVDTSIEGLAKYAAGAPARLTSELAEIAGHARQAQARFEREGIPAAVAPLLDGLDAVRGLRADLDRLGLDDTARYEIDTRLAAKQDQFEEAVVSAAGLRFDALADDGVVVGGETIKATMLVANRGLSTVDVKRVEFDGFEPAGAPCGGGSIGASGVYNCETDLRIPAAARLTAPYWKRLPDAARYEFEADAPFGLPFRPTPFLARLVLGVGGREITARLPVVHRYEGNIFSGEKRMELQVVPRFAVRVAPEIAIIPLATREVVEDRGTPRSHVRVHREVRVTVTNGVRGPAAGDVKLELPGWNATPSSAPLKFSREDEAQTVRFAIDLPATTPPGVYGMKAVARTDGANFDSGYQVIEYPHVQRRHVIQPATAALKVINVQTRPGLTIGYIMGVGDQVPPAIEQLGAKLELIDAEQLAWGDLSRYDAVVTGVRAYERREDLRAHNDRLLEYAERGGVVLVQYNKFEFNEAQYGPYAAKVSSGRITDETTPVTVLVPDHPVFRYPNRIGESAWKDWVQERGLYFLGERDPKYVDLVELTDPFENNPGPKRGALVEARIGRGRWIYVGLGLWRQLPAGTDGAYQLLANLISLAKAPPSAPATGARRGR